MINKIKQIVENNPKNYSRMIKSDSELMEYINSESEYSGDSLPAKNLFTS